MINQFLNFFSVRIRSVENLPFLLVWMKFFTLSPTIGLFFFFLFSVDHHNHFFRFSDSDIKYLRSIMPRCEDGFFKWLEEIDCRDVRIFAMQEGSVSPNGVLACRAHVNPFIFRWSFQESLYCDWKDLSLLSNF